MTGHAFQVLVKDSDLRVALAAIRSALTEDGRFAFETRNPLAREWERWTSARVREVQTPVEGDKVSFSHTFTSPKWDRPQISHSTLRFLDAGSLSTFLSEAGLKIEEQYGDWD